MTIRATTAAALGVLLAVGCSDPNAASSEARSASSPAVDSAAPGAEAFGPVTASLSVAPAGEGRRAVSLVLTGEESVPGSYQGRLEFASDLELVGVRTSERGFHVVNRDRAGQGQVRFAGYAAEGLPSTGVWTLTFAADRTLRAEDFRLRLDVVGTTAGREVPDDRVRIATELDRAETPAVPPSGKP